MLLGQFIINSKRQGKWWKKIYLILGLIIITFFTIASVLLEQMQIQLYKLELAPILRLISIDRLDFQNMCALLLMQISNNLLCRSEYKRIS